MRSLESESAANAVPHPDISVGSVASRTLSSCGHLFVGADRILAILPLLVSFSNRCNQAGTMEDLAYFLQKPGLLKRTPHLLLLTRNSVGTVGQFTVENMLGALLVHEYRFLGLRTRMFAINDRSGRGTLLGPEDQRLSVAALATSHMLALGARLVMLTLCVSENADPETVPFDLSDSQKRRTLGALRPRSNPAYLELRPTLDETLARVGQKTRSNMRYYRRKAESDLGCVFLPEIDPSEGDMLRFNRVSMYAVPESVARWRLHVQKRLHQPFLMGLKNRDGEWLSLVGGRRFGNSSEILWQMNRDGLPRHSIGTVMRSYCMEHEISRGATRFYIEGGTPHSMQHSFVQERLMDLAVVRRQWLTPLRRLARRVVPHDNTLAEMLKDDSVAWRELDKFGPTS